jgi:hypothetical protein
MDLVENPELIDSALKNTEQSPEIDYSKIDYSKLDYSKIDPTKIPHQLVQMSQPFQGLLSEHQDTRTKLKEALEDKEILASEINKKEQAEAKDPNETITRGEMLNSLKEVATEIVNKLTTENQKRETKREQDEAQKRLVNSANTLQREFTEQTAGKGLDATTVIKEGIQWLAVNEPELLAAARNSADPARKIYKLAITHVPVLVERVKDKLLIEKGTELIDSIQTGRIPKGGGVIPGGQSKSEVLKVLEMPEDQLLAAITQEELAD